MKRHLLSCYNCSLSTGYQTVGRKCEKNLLDGEPCCWLANEVYSSQILKASCYKSRSILKCCTNFSLNTSSKQPCCKWTGRRFSSNYKIGRMQVIPVSLPLFSTTLKFTMQPSMIVPIYFYHIHSSCCKTLETFSFWYIKTVSVIFPFSETAVI